MEQISIHVKYPLFLSDFNEAWIFTTDFKKKCCNIKFHENPFSGSRVILCGRTDMTKLISLFAILQIRLKTKLNLVTDYGGNKEAFF